MSTLPNPINIIGGLSSIMAISKVRTPFPDISKEVRDLVYEIPMNLYINCPYKASSSYYWRQALAQLGAKFNEATATWDLILDPNTNDPVLLADVMRTLSEKGVVKQVLPCTTKTRFSDFHYDPSAWFGMGKVLLRTSYAEKDELKAAIPSVVWNDLTKSWSVNIDVATASRGTNRDIIDQRGWFDGATTVINDPSALPCHVMPHSQVQKAVSFHGLFHAGYGSSVVMSVHPTMISSTQKVIYISYLRNANNGQAELIQFTGDRGRKIWNGLIRCGFVSDPDRTFVHVSAHKGALSKYHHEPNNTKAS